MSPAIRKRLIQIGFLVFLQAVMLFASVGKWDWWNAWVYLGLYLAFLVFNAVILLGKHKELVEERSQIGEGAKGWDKLIGGISAFGGVLIMLLAGLDERFGWPGSIRLETACRLPADGLNLPALHLGDGLQPLFLDHCPHPEGTRPHRPDRRAIPFHPPPRVLQPALFLYHPAHCPGFALGVHPDAVAGGQSLHPDGPGRPHSAERTAWLS